MQGRSLTYSQHRSTLGLRHGSVGANTSALKAMLHACFSLPGSWRRLAMDSGVVLSTVGLHAAVPGTAREAL